MIIVAGEALMDVLVEPSGRLDAVTGGASFNVARIAAGLGGDCRFLGRLSDDPFGARLGLELRQAGVTLATPEPLHAPTTLAMVQLDASGSAFYRFYGEGTAAAMLTPADMPAELLRNARALAVGGLGIVFEPVRSTLLALVEAAPPETLVVLDPNCRPDAVPDRHTYLATVDALAGRSDIVKLSRDDLTYLWPERDLAECGASLLQRGAGAVFVTDGAHPVTVFTASGSCSVPVPAVTMLDSIGAGDGFVAGLLVWCEEQPQFDPRTADLDSLRQAAAAAAEVAAAVCTARGGVLPESFLPVRFRSSKAAAPRSGRLTPDMLGVRSSGVVVHPSSGRPARSAPEVCRSLPGLIDRSRALTATGRRSLLGIAGPPGAGKSTLAEMLVAAVGERARVVGLDGFHLAQSQLVALGRRHRMGAIDTFDAPGFVALIRRLREENAGETIYAPEFRREFEESIAGVVAIQPSVDLVVVEGNYLLSDVPPWNQLRELLDEIWYCDHESQDRVAALIARHRLFGKSEAEAEGWVVDSDQRNAEAIEQTRGQADLIVELDWRSQGPVEQLAPAEQP